MWLQGGSGLITIEDQVAFYKVHGIVAGDHKEGHQKMGWNFCWGGGGGGGGGGAKNICLFDGLPFTL